MPTTEEVTAWGSVSRRRPGIWLANRGHAGSGEEDWDAFGTEAAARRWVRAWCEGLGAFRWEPRDPKRPGWSYGEATETVTFGEEEW